MSFAKVVAVCGIGAVMLISDVSGQSEVDHLRATEQARLRSLVDADLETARRLHADDFQLITPTGGTVSKEEYLDLIASGVVDYVEWEPEAIEVRLLGEVAAVLRYRAELRITVRGQPDAPTGRFWHTDLYEKRDGQWQVVWSQATQIQQ